MSNAIEIKDLNVELGKFALRDINLWVRKGAITGLVGANGAGKTTLIKTLMRCIDGVSGDILYDGKKFAGNEAEVFSTVACVFDSVLMNYRVKPKKFIKYYSRVYPGFNMELYEKLMQKFNLNPDLRIGKYSYGMQKKYNFILAYCSGAKTLILDETTAGIDPFDRSEIVTLLQEFMMDEEHAVLFSTHITEDLDKIADYIVMIDNGKIIMDTDKESLTENYLLVRTPTLTPEMREKAIGVTNDMFGYTFITKDKSIAECEGVQCKIPSVEELFVHLINEKNLSPTGSSSYRDIFGI